MRRWLSERIESEQQPPPVAGEEPHPWRLNAAEALETFLHTNYVGQKRFALEGAETVIALLDAVLSQAADQGVRRGRYRHGAPRAAERAGEYLASRTGRSSTSSRATSTRDRRKATAT